MSRVLNFIFVFVFGLFFVACGGGGGGSTGGTPQIDPVTLNGVAVDNYIKDATVCIDTNKNNTCDPDEKNTTTDANGAFSFDSVIPTDDMVIIAYGGRDADTNESFPYIIKNIATNTDSNDTVVLSSLNTLVTDYKFIANTTLENAKSKIATFIDSNDTTKLIADLVANKDANPDELVKSLTIFQMIEKINTTANVTNNYANSAQSFQALATAIKNNTFLQYNDANVSVTAHNTTVNATVTNMKPVFMSSPVISVNENQSNAIDINATDDNATLIYTISDTTNFDINSSTGVVTFKSNKLPDYETQSFYTFAVTVSDLTNEVNQTVTVNILNLNDAPVLGTALSFSINEDNNYTGTLPTAIDVDSSTLHYLVESGASHGSLSVNTNGTFTYAPTANYNGSDSFTYKVSDGLLDSAVQTVTITVNSVNDTPVITSSVTATVNENQKNAIDVDATDVDSNLTFSIVQNINDFDKFDINSSTGVVTFKVAPDYEIKSLYTFTITVSDGNISVDQNITIAINNLNDNQPEILGGGSPTLTVNENQVNAIDINATDLDGNSSLIYGIKNGLDKNYFQIVPLTGVITFITAPNYEDESEKTSYTFVATVSDGVTTKEQTITINIQNINEFTPIFTSENNLSVVENQTGAITLSATDADGDTLTYYITGTDENNFTINSSTGVVTFKSAPDYESEKTAYTFTAIVSDGDYNTTQNITIHILNQNDNSPVISGESTITATVDENQNSAIDINATDGDDDTLSYGISGGDSNYFDINNSTGVVTFKTDKLPDYESIKKSYTFVATVHDGQRFASPQQITISIQNLNDNLPEITSSSTPSVDENESVAMTVVATDTDNLNSLIYSMSDGNSSLFDINSSTGEVTFKNPELDNDYEKAHFYTFKVSVFDGNFTTEQNITLSINSVNLNAPKFTSLSTVTIDENQLSVLDINATDADSLDLNYSISAGINAELFDINSSTGVVTFKDINDSDYEKAHSYTFTASVTDSTYTTYQNVTININNLNDNAPMFTQDNNVTIPENQLRVIDDLYVTDADGNLTSLVYSISDGNASFFDINSSTGKITFKDINSNNYENMQNFTFKVTVNDGDYNATQDINITLSNLNDNLPVFTSSNSITVNENETFAIDINATDNDDNNLTFSIVQDVNDSASFDINSTTGVATFKVAPNYETKTIYRFTARVNDGIHDVDQNITININNLNDNSPVFTSNETQSADENNETAFITLSATDADNLNPMTYLISGGDSSSFEVNATTGKVSFTFTPDYETRTSYTFTAIASDGENNTTQNVTININNIVELTNDSPTDLSLSANTISENNEINITIGTLSSIDEDTPSGPFTYSLVQGSGDIDNSSFLISGNLLKIGIVADYESKTSYNIRIQTKDDQNATFEKEFVIYVSNVNEKPTISTTNYGNYDQSENFTTLALNVSDPDSGDTHTFTLNPNPNLGSLNINTTTGAIGGLVGDIDVGVHTITVRVTDQNGTGLYSDQNITLTINEINDKPISNYDNNEQNLTASPTTPAVLNIGSIGDGDSHLSQTVTLSIVENNNTDSILAEIVDATGTESGVNTKDGTASLRFTYLKAGQSTIIFQLSDGDLNTTYTVNVIARGSGWDLYQEQNASNYEVNTTIFDGVVYDWNATKKWYESEDTILLPIKNITNSAYLGADLNISNSGHYSMNKNKIIAESTVYPSSALSTNYTTARTFFTADGVTTISAKDNKFAYDGVNTFFVSRVLIDSNNLKSYNDNPSSYCASNYGTGWRLPTAVEIGNTQRTSEKYGQYIGAYVGDTTKIILTSSFSSQAGDTTKILGLKESNAAWDIYATSTQQYFRCVYKP